MSLNSTLWPTQKVEAVKKITLPMFIYTYSLVYTNGGSPLSQTSISQLLTSPSSSIQ